ncbi:Short C-terminal domain-containing protein [Clostridium cavendishii DSM 21758]|uniref:Short C-terminal domain-containing protein n=1 Tax=Clostridium cavendishii DSM 21758 TaxID=1121302 RepID=A0A1M6JZA8_9CLOT|nr:SHOCT domain-containing protein [Clostridium cavendishii]SHJ51922.1 Short C-terminal domain-containing protein [Clostridium cavendishii DSM 21758]
MLALDGKLGRKVVVEGEIVKISMGYLPFQKHRNKSVLIKDIVSVEVKKPGLSSGFILFQICGEDNKARKSISDAPSDNEILFGSKSKYETALKIKEYIENFKKNSNHSKTNNASTADEIMKFKKLCDDGIITKDEFEKQKSKLLG